MEKKNIGYFSSLISRTYLNKTTKNHHMARKKIREFDAKSLIMNNLGMDYKGILVDTSTNLDSRNEEWLKGKLVVKPDQLFGKRKKYDLVLINANFQEVKDFIKKKMGKEVTIGKSTDKLTHFLIEPFVPHKEEYYLAFTSEREANIIRFSTLGGVDIEENWDKVVEIKVPVLDELEKEILTTNLPDIPLEIINFIKQIFEVYRKHNFCYLEINPFTINDDSINILDTVAQVDSCTEKMNFPQEFGKKSCTEEQNIKKMDEHSGASLKLTILNPQGRIWNILSGGGASIILLDTMAALGYSNEIANYGEYSGNPTTEESYQYAKTIIDLMMREKNSEGKTLIIAGAIANFTDIKKTFQGICRALEEYQQKLRESNVKIIVRRGGPNYKEGLRLIERVGEEIGVPMEVYGPETNLTEGIKI